jgi:hypothetical protein
MLKFNKNAWIVFFLLVFVFGYFYQDPVWNGNSRIALSLALVREGRLTIDTYHDNEALGLVTGDRSFFNGHYYTDKAIGSSIIGALAYLPIYLFEKLFNLNLDMRLIKQWITFLGLGVPSALCGSLIYLVCEYFSKSRFRSYVVTLAISLGTMSFPFSIIFFGHQLAAIALFGAFFLIFRMKVLPDPGHPRHTFWIGLIMGLAIITEYPSAFLVFLLIPYFFYVLYQKKSFNFSRAILFPALGGLVPILMMVLYNLICYQNPFSIGYGFLVFQPYQAGMAKEFFGIGRPSLRVLFFQTFHPAVGIFWQSPVLLMTFVGAYFMIRSKEYIPEMLLAGLAAAVFLIWNSGYYMWWGGNSFAPRHLIPMLPFLCLPLIFIPRKFFGWVVLLTVISVIQMSFAAASDILAPDANLENIKKIGTFDFSMLYSYMLPHLIDGGFAWNLGNLLGLKQWVSLIPLEIVLIMTSIYMAIPNISLPKRTMAL